MPKDERSLFRQFILQPSDFSLTGALPLPVGMLPATDVGQSVAASLIMAFCG